MVPDDPGSPDPGVAGCAPGEPDPRLLYANERTFLAWIRTSLALLAAGLAIIELLPAFEVAGGRRLVGLPLIALGTWLAAMAFVNWTRNERAMRAGMPLPHNHLALLLTIGVAVVLLAAGYRARKRKEGASIRSSLPLISAGTVAVGILAIVIGSTG